MWRRPWVLAAVGGAVALVGAGFAFLLPSHPAAHQPKSLPVVAPSVTPSVQAASPAPAVSRSNPVRLLIPSLGVNAPVDQELTQVNPDGSREMQVPPLSGSQANDVGWWSPGFTPGQGGQAVLAGHVDSRAMGNLVFAHLDQLYTDLQAGKHDMAQVKLADGQIVQFSVVAGQEISKLPSSFWTTFWASATQTPSAAKAAPTLALVTCGGTFNDQSGHYLSNVVIYLQAVPAE